jgi:hypothetical protein
VLRRWNGKGVRIGMVAAALALLTGCAQAPSVPRSPTATPTSLPPAPLAWQAAAFPPGYNSLGAIHGPLAFAPSDGNTAYVCGVTGAGNQDSAPGVWVTHDRAAHWTRMADLPVSRTIGWCWIVVDSLNPAIAVAIVSWAPNDLGPVPNFDLDFATFDGGATWRQLGGNPEPFLVKQLATRQGTTLAILDSGVGGGDIRLWISTDQMRTWQPVSGPWGPEGWGNPVVWVNPGSGAILLQTGVDTARLWGSTDGGQHWSRLKTPTLDATTVLVAPPAAGKPWQICGITPYSADPSNGGQLLCSQDGGQTWAQRPLLTVTLSGPKGSYTQTGYPFAMTDDGTVLAELVQPPPNALYRLPPGAVAWQSLGPIPSDDLATAVVPGAGVLWEWKSNDNFGMIAGPYPASGP